MRIHLLCLRESDPGKNVTKTKTEQKVPEIKTQGTGSINSRWSTFRLTWLRQAGSIDSCRRILAVFYLICHQHDVANILFVNIVFKFLLIFKALRNSIKNIKFIFRPFTIFVIFLKILGVLL